MLLTLCNVVLRRVLQLGALRFRSNDLKELEIVVLRLSPGRRKGATRDGCPRNINEITRSAPIRRRIASFMMDHPTDDKSSSETCVAGVRSAQVWR